MSGEANINMRTSKDGEKDLWVSKKGFYMLWFEFLADSPSYELARQYRVGKLSAEDKKRLPADFDRVLAVYDDFGDVQRQQFKQWWDKTGIQICAFRSRKSRVTKVSALPRRKPDLEKIQSAVENYIDTAWRREGYQNTLILALPIGLTKASIAKQIGALLEPYSDAVKKTKPRPPKYALQGKRQNSNMLFRYMHVVRGRAEKPNLTLWRLGVRTKVSDTYSPVLQEDAKAILKEDTVDRMMLAIITSRALLRGKMIAENAARGVFPSYAACPNAVEPDLRKLYQRFVSRQKWLKQQAKAGDDETPHRLQRE